MKTNISYFYINRDYGSIQVSVTETLLSFAGICKNCAILAGAGNAFCLYQRAIMLKRFGADTTSINQDKKPKHNSQKIDCLGKLDNFAVDEKYDVSYFLTTYQIFNAGINPATETVPIGLPAYAQAVMVFAVLSIQFTYDKTTPTHLPELAKTTQAMDNKYN